MKIAILSANLFDDSFAGVENHVLYLSRELMQRGHDIQIFKPVWREAYSRDRDTIEGLNITYIDLGEKPYNLKRWSGGSLLGLLAGFLDKAAFSLRASRVFRSVRSWNPELVWQHDFSSGWRATRKLSRFYPVVLTNHSGEYLMLKKYGSLLLPVVFRHYKAVIGPSKELTPASAAIRHTIHNGVDTRLFFPLDDAARRAKKNELYGPDDRHVVFCPRRWAPTKGVLYLAQALRRLDSRPEIRDRFRFVFAGNATRFPPYVQEIERELEGLGIPVKRLGDLKPEAMIPHYQSADLVVLPSVLEAVSLAALEAMACKTPVLSTDVGGMPEIIRHGETGFLVPARDPEALANAIVTVFSDQTARLAVAENALEQVKESHEWSAIAKKTETVLMQAAR